MRRWIQHPRDVLRLSNGVKFSWPAVEGEIDPADLLAMEGLRLFDQVAFDWVRKNRDFLFSEGSYVLARDEEKADVIKALKQALPAENQRHVLKLLAVLFPLKVKDFEGQNAMGTENRAHVNARRGVGAAAGYDAYFGLHPPPEVIPKTVIDEIIRSQSDRGAVVRLIQPYLNMKDKAGRAMVGALLEELRFRFYGQERNPTLEFLQALFDVGESVLHVESTPEPFSPSPQGHLSHLISEILEIWGREQAGNHLVKAFHSTASAPFCATIFADRARELSKFSDSSSSTPKVEEKHLNAMGEHLMKLIDASAMDGTLRKAPAYWSIVESWKYLRGADQPRAWLSAGMNDSAQFLATATLGLVAYSLSRRERSYSVHNRPDETLFDLEVLRASCRKHLAGTELNADQRQRVGVVVDAVERLLADKQQAAEKDRE